MTKIYAVNFAGAQFTHSHAARLLLRYALLKDFNYKKAPEFTYGKRGKPFLVAPSNVWFNLSHSGDWAICAISDVGEIGVDIQKVTPAKTRVAERVFTAEQNAKLRTVSGAERDELFCEYWVLREAAIKAIGGSVFDSVDVSRARLIDAPEGYRVALAVI
ncbi:MAG: 4'-phosphopantetheinyl transferase superfamily protein [Oscillospiraceae bacterium]|jgi:4'-phosphopantetheinyl transferase|nr:4'-phosphopantetheinyl transferase superfamily protein [Oscillospiraceae bacterium]